MSTQQIDHYEALFDKKYLRWFHLNGKPALVEITKIEKGVELTLRGGAKKVSPVIHFKQVQGGITNMKPLVLNITNGDSIAAVTGESSTSNWIGKQVVLFIDETIVAGCKGKKPCIRIRAKKESS